MSEKEAQGKKARPKVSFTEGLPHFQVISGQQSKQVQRSPELDVDEEIRKADTEATKNLVRSMQESKLMRLKEEEEVKTEKLKLERAKIEKEKEELLTKRKDTTMEQPAGMTLQDAIELSKLPEDQREVVLQAWQIGKLAERQHAGELGPYLMMAMQQKPSSSASDLATLGNLMGDMFDRGIRIATPAEGGEKKDTALGVIKELREAGLLGASQQGGKQDDIDTLIKLRDLGLIVTPDKLLEMQKNKEGTYAPAAPAPPPTDHSLELERLRTETDIKLAEIKSHSNLEFAKMEIDRQKSTNLNNLITKGLTTAGMYLGKGEVQGLTRGSGAEPQGVVIPCPNCTAGIFVSDPSKPQPIKCVKCGQEGDYKPE